GDGFVDPGEQCDGSNLGGASCSTLGYYKVDGVLTCSSQCQLVTTDCGTASCGDGMIQEDENEQCDGSDLDGQSCQSLEYERGSLSCTAGCRFDVTDCVGSGSCGDFVIQVPEQCDGNELAGQTCQGLGYYSGTLGCGANCQFELGSCSGRCGDGNIDTIFQEECDGLNLNLETCVTRGFYGGALACGEDCLSYDETGCAVAGFCGDGTIQPAYGEQCDGAALQGATCASLGYYNTVGILACRADCTYDVSDCGARCGDSTVDVGDGEQCDGQNLSGATCQTLGFGAGGSLSCSSSCTFNTSACSNNTCGDGTINGTDQCDCGSSSSCTSAQLGGKTCASFTSPAGSAYAGGALDCLSPNNCSFDLAGCYYCGDGKIDPGEACDGAALGNQTCIGLGFVSGNLSCGANCQFNTSGCVSVPNPILECSAPNLVLLDNDPTGKSDTITISAAKQIVDVDVMLIVPHGWPGDVLVKLTHGSTTRTLIDQPGVPASTYGCSENDIDCTLDDEGTGPVENTCGSTVPAISGTLTPNESLSAFDGQGTGGAWTLQVADVESA
ncbi:MAG: hypothetical protein CVU63_16060, partial [Deltaproteobacteria bacterium HGW-Deltaproteobacteria-20]